MLIVANRLPVTVVKRRDGVRLVPSVGGLATGLRAVQQSEDRWIGWPGIARERLSADERTEVDVRLGAVHCQPVHLSQADVEAYYAGFSNRTLWPLAHSFPAYAVYERGYWEAYRRVNEAFAEATGEAATSDDTVWVHDYQLMLVPRELRLRRADATIGFFLHIPFPPWEVFRLLPWRREIVEGILGADLVGFHTHDYALHFLEAAQRLLGVEHRLGRLVVGERLVQVHAFPMGIDYERFARADEDPGVRRELERVRQETSGQRVVLSVDRLDYTKGIPQRLTAFDRFLDCYPDYRGRVTLVMVAVPSRTEVDRYQALRRDVQERIGGIEGRHATLGWTPIRYLYRPVPFSTLAALYRVADVALVTPLRDGMNLVAKEYVASRSDGRGVLILGETAGAARELSEALIVNPNDTEAVAEALHAALTMPVLEQVERNRKMQERLRAHDVRAWARQFIDDLRGVRGVQRRLAGRTLRGESRAALVSAYRGARWRLLLVDYDGTLVGFAGRPADAVPDVSLVELMKALAADPRNRLVLVSGRDRRTLETWWGALPADMAAEHGAWVREGGAWCLVTDDAPAWKVEVRRILDAYTVRTPGTFVEVKTLSLAWHYRLADPVLGSLRADELIATLSQLAGLWQLGIVAGNRVVEIKDGRVGKGRVAARWLQSREWDFVLAAGDDATDEEMFVAMPEDAHTIKVGFGPTRARHWVADPTEIREVLGELARAGAPRGDATEG
ncbi:MAG: bifunctional alpha,alpha-trehalose-phosphate synthase (UDP-forming)/trehalose-phosphatase [Armatimonadota bacterium]|nr:bifunctional alpha,alpha-trehalose-phosphate synthase (UDP-forming)/trehalose-phosphatase [Armatimonadota bacterium]